ncbi:hypothetical protein ABKV19_002681 [Rosa sericea]
MKSLKRLDLSGTAIKELPSSAIRYLINLEQLTLSGCKKLKHVPCNIFELQHLQLLDLSGCEKLVTFPTKSEMKSLKRLDLSGTAIKELPSSAIRYLINLEQLTLSGCKKLKHVPCNIFELQHLQLLDLSGCEKLVTFPTKSEMKSLKRLDLSGTAIKELPSSAIRYLINLEQLTLSGCKKLEHVPCNIFELQHLELLDLSGCEKLVTFPTKSEFSTESTSLEDKHYAPLFVNLSSCYDLAEIVEFPREIYSINASGCFVLKRISKLLNILEGKESKMAPWMNLFHCDELYRTLARDVAKVKKNLPDNSRLAGLLSLFFLCRQSEYQVLFPGSIRSYERLFGKVESSWRLPEIGLPQWFTCSMYISNKGLQVCNFGIDFPGNFKWEDKGLAFSALTIDNENLYTKAYMRVLKIYINDVRIIDASEKPEDSRSGSFYDLVWLYYVPFDTIIKRLGESGLPPPSMCLVKFEFEYKTLDGGEDINGWIGSCWVHVVMPEDEGPFVNGIVRPSTLIMGTNSYPGDDAEDPPTV